MKKVSLILMIYMGNFQINTELANTISAGVSVDLDAAAQGLGHDSFAAAVEAYNEEIELVIQLTQLERN